MSSTVGIQNMGFPEVPDDAFDAFDLPPSPLPLTRTYKANCPYCYARSGTMDPDNRSVPCIRCSFTRIPLMQGLVRGYLTRMRIRRLRRRDLMHRWFLTGGCDGGDLSWYMSSFF